ncbi:AcrB/AcrD/AcrF family protein [Halomonas sp. Choline-3u-9]|uniref:efflux RND transporter permease subunit n=1 Tax=unclassified Halomonas TaxID=2609666 RepID=UPI00048476B7|nr:MULTISPECIES: efflux RND transporter permease subunit [unclassified Halomonas]NAO96205.1 MMPL family transporter [Halomonas sp. MG34]PKH58645.1 AcrB/AcrD/AcrF family protein [Halomonas sp. Choline-3u-9]
MTLNTSSWAIRNPIPVVLLFILLTFWGLISFRGLFIQDLPDVQLPRVEVSASLPGAAPALMENEVARKIEDAIATVSGVKHITTTLTDGNADIAIEFRLEKSLQEAVEDVRDAVSRIRSDLPADLRDPVIRKSEFSSEPIVRYAVTSSVLDDEALSWFVDDKMTKAVLVVPGVGSVRRIGGVDREVRVALDPDRLLAMNTTALDISRQLRQAQLEAPGGRVDVGGVEQAVRIIANAESAAELAKMELALSDGRRIRLDEVATVTDTVAERRSMALLNGVPVVGFEMTRAEGYGEVDVAEGVQSALAALQVQYPHVEVEEAFNFVGPVQENYQGSMHILFEGMALAVLVVFCFLRNWRATLIAAVTLPLSIIPTFAFMHLMGFSLNTVTLLALSLVIGVLVDDAIVEIENIERHLLMGKPPRQAAMDAAAEIGLAVVATTFTLIAVFLPTAFMSGTVGQFFVQFGWTASVAVLFSLLVARLLTPMLAAYLLRKPHQHPRDPAWISYYLVVARWCLRHRKTTLFAAAACFAGGAWLASTLPGSFIPPDDNSLTQATLTLPPGSTLSEAAVLAEQSRSRLATQRHVVSVFAAVGEGSGSSDGAVTSVVLTVSLADRATRAGVKQQEIEQQLRVALATLPGVRSRVGTEGDTYELVLAGEDSRVLELHARQVDRELRAIPGLGAVSSTASLARPELIVRLDFARAADLGVSAQAIADTVRIATVGDSAEDLPKLNFSSRQVPVMVRLADAAREDMATIKRLPVPGANGMVPLESVTSFEWSSGPSEITRHDRLRNVNFEVSLQGRPLGEIEQFVQTLPSLRELPRGVYQTTAGDAEEMAELATSFGIAMLTGVLCIYMVLVLLLKDFMQPVTILVALVLSIPGAFLALFLTQSPVSLPAMIGLIMLMGIATKNSILLVDYIIIARQAHGIERADAILDACKKRVRPIVMTTIAMGAGMVPIALGWAGDPSFRAPMAFVVIGGLITSTLLSLLVIPVVYSYVDDGVHALKYRNLRQR